MKTFEFQAEVKNGTIVLPRQFNKYSVPKSKIIVLVLDDNSTSNAKPKNEKLEQAFIRLQEVNPFRNITNAVDWQKQIRDEWEERIIRQ